MEKKKIITVIILIPKTNDSVNAFETMDKLAQKLGYLNCNQSDDAALISYEGVMPNTHKEQLIDAATTDEFELLFIEAYENDPKLDEGYTVNLIKK